MKSPSRPLIVRDFSFLTTGTSTLRTIGIENFLLASLGPGSFNSKFHAILNCILCPPWSRFFISKLGLLIFVEPFDFVGICLKCVIFYMSGLVYIALSVSERLFY